LRKVLALSKAVNGKFRFKNDSEYYSELIKQPDVIKYKAYDRLSNLISLYFSEQEYKERYIEKTKKELIPIIEQEMPEMVEKYNRVFKFLSRNSISEYEIKRVEELKRIREIEESIKKG
jgi:hypothetical protein